jgi:hypothetical protein
LINAPALDAIQCQNLEATIHIAPANFLLQPYCDEKKAIEDMGAMHILALICGAG